MKPIIKSVSKIYKNINKEKGPKYYDYENYVINWNLPKKYQIIRKIGRGKYSDVFEGINIDENSKIIIKVLKPVRFKKIQREVKLLNNLKNGRNIVKLLDLVKCPDTHYQSFIFEHIDGIDMRAASSKFTVEDIRHYLYLLLQSLDYCHSMGIIHRDVKPRNIMLNPKTKELRLIDWGLGEFYHPSQEYNVRVATRNYKAPELLVDYRFYDYSLDMWNVGCILAGLIFKKDPFFRGENNVNQLVKIVRVLGTPNFEAYVEKYNIEKSVPVRTLIKKKFDKKNWSTFVTSDNRKLVTKDALVLLDKLLVYDHSQRLTAKEAMADPYFDSVRQKIELSQKEKN